MEISGFEVTHRDKVVTVRRAASAEEFDQRLQEARKMLWAFKSTLTNTWGCDGVGYYAQRDAGMVEVHLSSVGPVNFRRGLDKLLSAARTESVEASFGVNHHSGTCGCH